MSLTLSELRSKSIHFIGMGGAGMSGIARIAISQGMKISGSDAKDSLTLQGLASLGATTYIGHSANQISTSEVVVVSSAIDAANPELIAAQEKKLTILGRAQALAILMSESTSVAVAGTHGKTTTTSMLTVALQGAGLDPSFAIGGTINSAGTNAHFGSGKIFVVEADESDGSFVAYKPHGAIITNIEWDHVDHFPDFQAVSDTFVAFIDSLAPHAFLIACIDSPGVRELLARITRTDLRVVTYGEGGDLALSHIALSASQSSARVTHGGRVLGELQLAVPGAHNLANAVAALAAGIELGAPHAKLLAGLAHFTGARRRFEVKGEVSGITVIDDYGHHPTEVEVTLETARRYVGSGRVHVIFQPHRYSRTQVFTQEFAKVLSMADNAYLLEIYGASEDPIPGISAQNIVRLMDSTKAHFEPSMVDVVHRVAGEAKPGDLILTLGAGDVNSLGPVILSALSEKFTS